MSEKMWNGDEYERTEKIVKGRMKEHEFFSHPIPFRNRQ